MGLWDSFVDGFSTGIGKGFEWFVTGSAAASGSPQVQQSLQDPSQKAETVATVGQGISTGAALIDQGISTAILTVDPTDSGGFDLNLRDNWDRAKYVSPGQALVGAAGGIASGLGGESFGAGNPLSARSQVNDAINQKRMVGYIDDQGVWRGGFKNNSAANLVSGSSDASFDWFLDPLVVAGKGAKVARSAVFTRPITSTKGIERSVAAINSGTGGWGAAIKATRGMTTADMLRLDWVREAADPDLLASTLRYVADDADEVADYAAKSEVLRAGLGDRLALEKLAAEKPAVADAISQNRKAAFEIKQSDIPDADELARLDAVYNDLVARDALLGRLVTEATDSANPTRSLAGTVGRNRTVSRIGSWETRKAEAAKAAGRARRSYLTDPAGGFEFATTRGGKGFRPVTVMRWIGDERPAGWVGVSGAPVQDASREIAAFARRAKLDEVEWIDRFTREATDQGRSTVARQLEEAAWTRIAAQAGVEEGFARATYAQMNLKRNSVIAAYKDRAFGVNEDGSLLVDPMLTSQMADSVPLFDADLLRQALNEQAKSGSLARSAYMTAADKATRVQQFVDVYWRPAVLLRGGYAPRNLFEGAGRVAATLPAMFKDLPQGVVNYGKNRARGAANLVDTATEGSSASLVRRISDLSAERQALLDEVRVAEGQLPTGGVGLAVRKQARIDQLAAEIDDLVARLDTRASVEAELGKRSFAGQGKLDLGDGIEANDAFAGSSGQAALGNASGQITRRQELDPAGITQGKSLGDWGTVTLADDNYFDAFSQAVRQFANDPVARKVLAGESGQDIYRWLMSPKAADVRRAYGISRGEAYEKVGNIIGLVRRYVPDDVAPLALADEPLTPAQWAAKLAGREDLPDIHGRRIVEEAKSRKSFREGWQAATGKIFEYIGTLPEDRLLRHPFYRTTYRAELRRQKDLWVGQGGEITDALVKRWEAVAHKAALQDTKRTLYTIERYSNVAFYGRAIAPFIAATNNTVRTWGRIIGRDPSVLARADMAWQAPSTAGLLWDRDENRPVPPGTRIGLDDRYQVLMPIPKSWTDKLGVTNPEDPLSRIQLAPPQTSFNVALQSDPIWSPGYGPLVTMPLAAMANSTVGENAVVSWAANNLVFPEGVPREVWKSAMPAWLRQAINKEDEDGTVRTRIYTTMLVREQERFRNGERSTEPTPDEINGRVDSWMNLRILGAATLPFAATLRDETFQFYVDEAARFRREYGIDWFDKYQEAYPEAGDYAFSVSRNDSGVRATVSDVANAKRYSGLIADVTNDDPSLAGLLTNDGSPYDFDSASYNWTYGRSLAPGSSEKFRGTQSAQEAADAARVQQGWSEYRKVRTERDALLAARGLTPQQIERAPDIKAVWDQWMVTQRDDPVNGNQQWWNAYQQRDGAKYQKTINGLEKILADEKFRQGPIGSGTEFQLVEQYLTARQDMLDLLAQRAAAGYASTLTAQDNADVAAVWNQYVNGLVASNTRFADIYTRYLDGEFERLVD